MEQGELGQRVADRRRHSYRSTAVEERDFEGSGASKSMLNFASNETPAILLASERASELQITVSPSDCFYS